MNEDPVVMRYMPRPLRRNESFQWADAIKDEFRRDGFGLWALELPGKASLIGFTGLDRVAFAAHLTPAVEIGWRLSSKFLGQGFATEAAIEALSAAFEQSGIEEVVANTFAGNTPSRRVMARIG